MYEFLFCPQHGLFRPENLAMIVTYWDGVWAIAQSAWRKVCQL